MKIDSNHRLITIKGIKYAWSISKGINEYTTQEYDYLKFLRIWEKNNKKFMFEQKIPSHKTIDSKLIKELINAKDNIERIIIISEPCPFCQGKVSEHPNPEWRENFFACYHDENCFLCEGEKPMNFTLIKTNHINTWNYRNLN